MNRREFALDVLHRLELPETPENVVALVALVAADKELGKAGPEAVADQLAGDLFGYVRAALGNGHDASAVIDAAGASPWRIEHGPAVLAGVREHFDRHADGSATATAPAAKDAEPPAPAPAKKAPAKKAAKKAAPRDRRQAPEKLDVPAFPGIPAPAKKAGGTKKAASR